METVLQRLIDLVEQTAPELWEIAAREVTGEVIGSAMWLGLVVFMAACFFGGFVHFSKLYRLDSKDERWSAAEDWQFARWALFSLGCCCVFAIMGITGSIARRLYNPDYYAIDALLRMMQ
jgi:hypothetical protein